MTKRHHTYCTFHDKLPTVLPTVAGHLALAQPVTADESTPQPPGW